MYIYSINEFTIFLHVIIGNAVVSVLPRHGERDGIYYISEKNHDTFPVWKNLDNPTLNDK